MEPFSLVVMEHAAEWPADVNGAGGGCVALAQEPEESHQHLLRRTYERIRAIELIGGTVRLAVLSCNDDGSLGAVDGRDPLARALLATVLRTGEGRLDLVVRSSAPDRARQSVLALAGTLTEATAGTSVSVSVRFAGAASGDPPKSRKRTGPARVDEGRPAA